MTAQGRMQRTDGVHSLRRSSVVVFEQSAQALAADDPAVGTSNRILGLNDFVLEPLMISFGVKVLDVFRHGMAKHLLAEEDYFFQALRLDRPDPSLGVCIQVWTLRRQADRFYAGSFQLMQDYMRDEPEKFRRAKEF